MIASVHGTLVQKDTDGVVVECAGVGYGLSLSLSALTKLGPEGSEVRLLVHTHLTQDALRLYGFIEPVERQAFTILLNTSGVGPRLALAILSTLSPDELADVVSRGDKGMLTRIPGVGGKKAERLLLELKGRLQLSTATSLAPSRASLQNDLVSALVNVGFNPKVAEAAAESALESLPGEQNLAVLVREALRSTTKMASAS